MLLFLVIMLFSARYPAALSLASTCDCAFASPFFSWSSLSCFSQPNPCHLLFLLRFILQIILSLLDSPFSAASNVPFPEPRYLLRKCTGLRPETRLESTITYHHGESFGFAVQIPFRNLDNGKRPGLWPFARMVLSVVWAFGPSQEKLCFSKRDRRREKSKAHQSFALLGWGVLGP